MSPKKNQTLHRQIPTVKKGISTIEHTFQGIEEIRLQFQDL